MAFSRFIRHVILLTMNRRELLKKELFRLFFDKLAEKEGFEPSVPCGTPDFESGTFDHSATSPDIQYIPQIDFKFSQLN